MITRRSLFLGAAAVILTPDLLMPVKPDRLVYYSMESLKSTPQRMYNGRLTLLTDHDIPGSVFYGVPDWSHHYKDQEAYITGLYLNETRRRIEGVKNEIAEWNRRFSRA